MNGNWVYYEDGVANKEKYSYVSFNGGVFLPNGSDWYFVSNGQVQTQYTRLTEYDDAWFYVVNGALAEDYTGNVDYDGAAFSVVNGMLQ